MDIIDRIGESITAKGKEAADKARELAQIASLKGQISTCEEVVKKNYLEIGRLYVEKHGENPEDEFSRQCAAVLNARRGISELNKKIDEIKGI